MDSMLVLTVKVRRREYSETAALWGRMGNPKNDGW